MPWARIPPDKLIHLPLFGIDVVVPDDGDFFWVRGPKGRMRVSKKMPRVWFDSVEDAMQCGALGIRIASEAELSEYDEVMAKLEAENQVAATAPDEPVAEDEAEPHG